MISEIGSEFHTLLQDKGKGIILPRNGSLVFSGRTAIEAVLREMPHIKSALLPSYCCASMIAPFIKNGIYVKFFDVNWENGLKIKLDDTADILFWCNYFGYRNKMPDFDGVIIEDITHSFFSEESYHLNSDYLVASLRKWEPIICGGYCSIKIDGVKPPNEFVDIKSKAMSLKKDYLDGIISEKKLFLDLFANCNQWIADNYSEFEIDDTSREYLMHVDVDKQKEIRCENAKFLYEGLKGKVQFLFQQEELDCPLFVPILLSNRDEVRQHLLKNGIYCPVHWPRPEGCQSNIYDLELSLICDQRYGYKDMKRIIETLLEVI